MSFIAGFALGAFAGGIFGALIVMLFTAGKISDLQDRIDDLEKKSTTNWDWKSQERVL